MSFEKMKQLVVEIRPEMLKTERPELMRAWHEAYTELVRNGAYLCECGAPLMELPNGEGNQHWLVCMECAKRVSIETGRGVA